MNPVIVALDVPDLDAARRLLDRLDGQVDYFKIGKELFTATGPESVRLVHSYGKRVFLDLKYHDIPNTVAGAVRSAAGLGVWMLNVHASGGSAMLKAAADAAPGGSPHVIGVTVLTSMDDGLWQEAFGGGARSVADQVPVLAKLSKACGLSGVVASPREIVTIREACGDEFLIVTPGVRPEWASMDDQRRAMTPAEAVKRGASYLVIGRPIAAADDPAKAAARVRDEIDALGAS
ncbi:MAG: orotidine-5'-phosphate decarboxylase [Candidatus Poribacteria bacterium]|nr:orotidine-5'-phosphate decarboxylase [Candidatus Poribacteria bacterium]